MTLYKIYTPNPLFCGERAGVTFVAGYGATTDASRAEELGRMGYLVQIETELVDFGQFKPAVSLADGSGNGTGQAIQTTGTTGTTGHKSRRTRTQAETLREPLQGPIQKPSQLEDAGS